MRRLLIGLVVALAACAPRATYPVGTAVYGAPLPHLNLRVIAGDGQTIPVGSTTPNPVIVGVVDDGGYAVPGITLGFATFDRGTPVIVVDDDASGIAKATVPAVARGPQTITIFRWAGYGYATPVTVTVTGY